MKSAEIIFLTYYFREFISTKVTVMLMNTNMFSLHTSRKENMC